jgi:hypothetical protein
MILMFSSVQAESGLPLRSSLNGKRRSDFFTAMRARQSGEPYVTVQHLVRKAEAEFECRHTVGTPLESTARVSGSRIT